MIGIAMWGATGWCGAQPAGSNRVVVVTATPLPVQADSLGVRVEVIAPDAGPAAGSLSIPEVLQSAGTTLDVNARGGSGIQSDLSIRGSSFEQVLVTMDGLSLTDDQTGHHNMDIPFGPPAFQSIAVIPGPGSALFGPTAFAGTVDLTPRAPSATRLRSRAGLGRFNTRRGEVVADLAADPHALSAGAAAESSDGFMDGTDYDTRTVWGSSFLDFNSTSLRLSAGYADKDFGARDFYAPYPSREQTRTTVIDVAPQTELGAGWLCRGIARYRRHDDLFVLIDDNPAYYRNRHQTDSFAEKIVLSSPPHRLGRTAVGTERSDSDLDSSNLGRRAAWRNAVFAQHRIAWGRQAVDAGLRADDHDAWGTEVSPSLAVVSTVADGLRLRLAGGRGIRPPSFTDLYYSDPRNRGNPDLRPEEAWGSEAGLDARLTDSLDGSLTLFRREAKDLIDWVRASPAEPWRAENVGESTTQGAEAVFHARAEPLTWTLSYRYTDVDAAEQGLESKYALNVARQDAGVQVALPPSLPWSGFVGIRWRDVPTLRDYALLTARGARRIGPVTLYVQGNNLLDRDYETIPDVPVAGRYVECGVEAAW